MAFALSGHNLPYVANFEQAAIYWSGAKQWRDDALTRAFGNQKKRYLTIRHVLLDGMQSNGIHRRCEYVVKYHTTDVLTYHDDNSITVRPYDSLSTKILFDAVLGRGIHIDPCYQCDGGKATVMIAGDNNYHEDATIYNVAGYALDKDVENIKNKDGLDLGAAGLNILRLNTFRIRKTTQDNGESRWELLDQDKVTVPFVKYKLDRKAANAVVKKYEIDAFEAWLAATLAFKPELAPDGYYANNYSRHYVRARERDKAHRMNIESLLEILALPVEERFPRLTHEYGIDCAQRMRNMLYAREGCIERLKLKTLTGGTALRSLVVNKRKWSDYMRKYY